MLILTIRTDKPEAEIGLFDDQNKLDYVTWQAHRELSVTIHHKIEDLLAKHDKTLQDLVAIVAFEGPGSFTGLRIGLTVANVLSYSLQLPLAGRRGEEWIQEGIDKVLTGGHDSLVVPHYGADAHITLPSK